MGVDIFIGGPWSSMAQGSLSYVNENDMLMVSASSTSPLLAIENDRLFRICPTDYVQARTIAEMWDSWGADAVLIIQRRDSWGDGIYNLLVPELEARGITIIGRVRYSVDTTDFKSYLNTMDSLLENAIAEYGVERVGVQTMMFDEIVDLVSLTSAFPNTRKVIWMGTETSGRNQKMIDEAGGKQVELKMFSAIMEPPSSSEWESFESRYYALTSQSAGFYTATAYDAAWILAKSIIQTGSLDASKIADAFPDVSDSHYGVSGLTNLDKNGDREPGHFNIWGYADNSYGFTLYGTFDGNTNNLVWDDEELTNQGVSRPGLTE
jgi:branched-chain amino acid transport system substrate-binding protein